MEKDDKKKKPSAIKKADSIVINTKPVLPGVNEQGFAVASKDSVIEKVLSLSQRRQRSIQMHKNQPRLIRGRKIAKTRMAPADRLRMRADMIARNIVRRKFAGQRGAEYQTLSPSDKIAVDRLIDKKVQLIKRIADRLIPRVKAAEVQRLQSARSGHAAVKKGALAGGPLFQSMEFKGLVDALLTEEYNDKMEKLLRLGLGDKDKLNQFRQALKNPEQSGKYAVLRKHLLSMLDKLSSLVTDDPTVFQKTKAKLQKERDYPEKKESEKVEESLIRKSVKSGVPFEILAEVYNRGYSAWNDGMKHDAEQNAFHRVNSYISGGKARELDSDIVAEDLRDWFKDKWVRMDTKGNIKGDCAREEGEGKPKCLPMAKARAMDKGDRATAARRKRREDPVADRAGKGNAPVNVRTEEYLEEKNKPTNPALWSRAKSLARSKFDVYPSAYANGWASKWYKSKGGGWKSVSEDVQSEACWDGYKRQGMKKKNGKLVPNCVPEETAIEKKPKLSNKTIKRELSTIPLKSMDPMSEKCETAEKQSKNPKDSSSRFDATDSLVNLYKKETRGENKITKKLKEMTVAGFEGKKIKVANQKIRMADGTIKSRPPGKSGSSGGGGAGGDGGGE